MPTPWHVDLAAAPFATERCPHPHASPPYEGGGRRYLHDGGRFITAWLALVDTAPEMGSLRPDDDDGDGDEMMGPLPPAIHPPSDAMAHRYVCGRFAHGSHRAAVTGWDLDEGQLAQEFELSEGEPMQAMPTMIPPPDATQCGGVTSRADQPGLHVWAGHRAHRSLLVCMDGACGCRLATCCSIWGGRPMGRMATGASGHARHAHTPWPGPGALTRPWGSGGRPMWRPSFLWAHAWCSWRRR